MVSPEEQSTKRTAAEWWWRLLDWGVGVSSALITFVIVGYFVLWVPHDHSDRFVSSDLRWNAAIVAECFNNEECYKANPSCHEIRATIGQEPTGEIPLLSPCEGSVPEDYINKQNLDPWGNKIRYEVERDKESNKCVLQLVSDGQDQQPGTRKDVYSDTYSLGSCDDL